MIAWRLGSTTNEMPVVCKIDAPSSTLPLSRLVRVRWQRWLQASCNRRVARQQGSSRSIELWHSEDRLVRTGYRHLLYQAGQEVERVQVFARFADKTAFSAQTLQSDCHVGSITTNRAQEGFSRLEALFLVQETANRLPLRRQ